MIEGWKYYNHAVIPTTAPHEPVNLSPITDGKIWEVGGGTPVLVRWSSDWDCGHETEWWFCIKDTPFDITALKSKRRYEINKGKKNFEVKKIDPAAFKEDLFRVTVAAYSEWPEKYRPKVDEQGFCKQVESWGDADVFAGFNIETNTVNGFALIFDKGSYAEFSVLRVKPESEKLAINAALVAGILEYYQDRFDGKFYINDGSRAIRHETAFQDYLEKYFDFRKAYCKLNVKYKSYIGVVVKLLYPCRKLIKGRTGLGSQIEGILKMEEIRRSF